MGCGVEGQQYQNEDDIHECFLGLAVATLAVTRRSVFSRA